MNNQKLSAAIIELKGILEDMKALLAWRKFRQFENTQCSISNLQFYDTTLHDLNNKYSSFLSLASQIHAELKNGNISKTKFRTIKKELTKIELQACYLDSGVRIY